MGNGARERRRGVSLSPRAAGRSASPPVSVGVAGQALGASNQSVLERFGPPRLSYAQLQAVLAESERPIREWLDTNVAYVRGLSLAAATHEVLRALPSVADIGAGSVSGAIESWARERGITLPAQSVVPHPADRAAGAAGDSSGVIDRLKRAVEAATRGTAIVEGDAGDLRIAATGVTARLHGNGVEARAEAGAGGVEARIEGEAGSARVGTSGAAVSLQSGDLEIGGRINWSGQMSLVASAHDFHFNATLAPDRWSLRLSFPRAQMPQDISALAGIFGNGATALTAIARETATFRNIDQIPDIADRVSPHMAPVRRAIDAASRVARAPLGVSFGVEVGGPTRSPVPAATGEQGRGIETRAVLTIRF